ncbi:hypothetical protein [Massilia sp. PWRC2]|uniref:hypothetical protein n=1 Tax=Massilia sp. PWRC2 TaxID=2804626 RepID=UPI003CE7D15C
MRHFEQHALAQRAAGFGQQDARMRAGSQRRQHAVWLAGARQRRRRGGGALVSLTKYAASTTRALPLTCAAQ